MVSELKARGELVVVIVVGSTDTRIEIENTIKTLKSYESIADLRESPVVMYYVENTKEESRFEVNKKVKDSLSLLLGLFSGEHEELDRADLKNWLEFLPFTRGRAQLSSLNFMINQQDLQHIGAANSVATLATPEMNTSIDAIPAYQCVGHPPESWRSGTANSVQMINKTPIHYVINTDFISRAVAHLNAKLKEVDAAFASQNARPSLLAERDTATDNGLIL